MTLNKEPNVAKRVAARQHFTPIRVIEHVNMIGQIKDLQPPQTLLIRHQGLKS